MPKDRVLVAVVEDAVVVVHPVVGVHRDDRGPLRVERLLQRLGLVAGERGPARDPGALAGRWVEAVLAFADAGLGGVRHLAVQREAVVPEEREAELARGAVAAAGAAAVL